MAGANRVKCRNEPMNRILLPMRPSLLIIALAHLMLIGCAGHAIYPELRRSLAAGDCRSAAQLIDGSANAYGNRSELLYLLDSAMVALHCKEFPLAQERLHAAEQLADRLWTESISRNAAAIVSNDYMLPYSGEDYERVLIHIISAIGYTQMDQPDEALVEVRRLDSLLSMFADAYPDDAVYKKDAFGRYLSGMLHEADGALDDAFIDYYKAAGIYQNEWRRYGAGLPDILIRDLLRMGDRVGRLDDARAVLPPGAVNRPAPGPDDPSGAKVVLIVFSGEGPRKVQDMAVVPTPAGPVGVAFPRIVTGAPGCENDALIMTGASGALEAPLSLVSDINQIARKSLDDRRGRIVAKAVARAVAKQVVITGIAGSQSGRNNKNAVAALLNLANLLMLEKADTRSWRTLPGRIRMARILAAPGTYRVRLRSCRNRVHDLGKVNLAAGETRFLFLDTHFEPRPS